jgi:hypothetical protein
MICKTETMASLDWRKWSICFLMFMLAAGFFSSAQNPYIHQYNTHDGLPSNTIYYICQDSKKFIWFATDAGVSRFDGTNFMNYRKKDGLANNEVIRIKEDSFGRVWFFHFNGTLSFFFRNKIYNESNTPFLKSAQGNEFFFDFFQGADSTICFYNRFCEIIVIDKRNAIQRYDLQDKLILTKSHRSEGPPRIFLRRITNSASGDFLLWTGIGIFRLRTFSDQPRLISQRVKIFTFFPAGNNTFFIDSYTEKLYKFRDERLIDSIRVPNYSRFFLKSVLEDKNDLVWLAGYNNGVYCLRRDTILHRFDIEKPQSLFRDHENNIWIGSINDGVFKISPDFLSHRHYPVTVFNNKGILGMSPEWSGGVWLTSGSHVHLLKNNVLYKLCFGNGKDNLSLVSQMKKGSLIIGKEATFYALDGVWPDYTTKRLNYRRSDKIIEDVKSIAVKRNGEEICMNAQLTLFFFDRDKMFLKKTGINLGQRIYSIFYDLNENLVVNARKMFLYRENRLEPYGALSRFDNKVITNHLVIGKTTELFNIEGDSIYLYNKKTFYNLTDAFGSPIDLQVRNITYHEPTLYLSTSRNVYRCDNPLDVIARGTVRLRLLDINFRNIHDILVNKDSLYIASDDGLTIIPETFIGKKPVNIPIPYIQSVFVNDQEQPPGGPGLPVRGSTKIAFSFGCINYSLTPVLYAYKLDGLDTSWTMATSGNVVYQRLLAGNYVFKLKVRKSTSEWSRVIEYPIVIYASIWRHPLFFLFIAAIVLMVVTLLIIRRKNNQMKKQELEHHLMTLELKSLQAMMNPHFIFNALGSIQNFLLLNKTGEAGLYLSQFARLIRQNMNAIKEAMINLEEEVDRLKNYLDLEKLRMENKFDYRIDVDENVDAEELLIPSMIIQPFVENSIWHGISALDGQGIITIQFAQQDDQLLKVIVEDNGVGMKKAQTYKAKDEKHLNLGMEMTRKRLELLGRKYGIKTRVEFSEAMPGSPNPGTRVVVIMPFIYFDSGL